MPYKSTRKLIEIQNIIGRRVLESIKPLEREPKLILGLDAAYSRKYGGVAVAALTSIDGKLLTYKIALGEPPLEYIPGLLAFREAPLLYSAAQQVKEDYDVIIVDGHGLSHPRHAGIASHMGLALGKPSIGVAKKKLYGSIKLLEEPKKLNEQLLLEGYLEDETGRLAAIVRLAPGKRHIYISPGAHITLEDAIRIVASTMKRGMSLPAATYYADKISKTIARALDKGEIEPNKLRRGATLHFLDMYL